MKAYRSGFTGALGVISLLFSAFSFAGGVSDGGGGTTNPNPANPDWITFAAGEYGRVIQAWLYKQEKDFLELRPEERTLSSYSKLFGHSKDVFSVLPSVKFELRMNAPCLDANGAPKDASIFGKEEGSLCLSPYSMAPKLNEQNYDRETVALMIHEISHLMGTTEEEAVKIQKDALLDLNKISLSDENTSIDVLGSNGVSGPLPEQIFEMKFWFSADFTKIRRDLTQSDITAMTKDVSMLRNQIEPWNKGILLVRSSTFKRYLPQYVKLGVIGDYLCSEDSREDAASRAYCKNKLDSAFQSETSLTIRQVLLRRDGSDMGEDYDLVTVKRPSNWDDVRDELHEVFNYFSGIQSEFAALRSFKISYYVTR
jgi:hypothetical protein